MPDADRTSPSHAPAELRARAQKWIAGDPDPDTVRELAELLESGDLHWLADHVGADLAFGTAGLRALVGPGPNRMNRAVVLRTTAGLSHYLIESVPDAAARGVIVGFDARQHSELFARDVVGVLSAAGIATHWFTKPQPTPIIAYAQKSMKAAAAVVITASHNPAEYNGYKVYGADAAQIIPPVDHAIAQAINTVGPARDVPCDDPAASPHVHPVPDEVIERYLEEIATTVPSSPGPSVTVAYTPLHGVGSTLIRRALADAGHHELHIVEAQRQPDPSFPTVAFPNPEEPGAMDAVMALAAEVDADLAVANDPDADRFAVAVPDGEGGFRALTGNQIGILLADHLLDAAETDAGLVVSSIVSTPMVHAVAAAHGARSEVTLTGFKWICSAARALEQAHGLRFVYGFEEALGSCVGTIVRDKDGISAAVAFADLVRRELAEGGSVHQRLERLHRQHGLWVSHQLSITCPGTQGADRIACAMGRVVEHAPDVLAGRAVTEITDFRVGAAARPPWLGRHDLVVFDLADGRAMIRPSGTEPKCKIYVDLRAEIGAHGQPHALEPLLGQEAARVAEDLARLVGLS